MKIKELKLNSTILAIKKGGVAIKLKQHFKIKEELSHEIAKILLSKKKEQAKIKNNRGHPLLQTKHISRAQEKLKKIEAQENGVRDKLKVEDKATNLLNAKLFHLERREEKLEQQLVEREVVQENCINDLLCEELVSYQAGRKLLEIGESGEEALFLNVTLQASAGDKLVSGASSFLNREKDQGHFFSQQHNQKDQEQSEKAKIELKSDHEQQLVVEVALKSGSQVEILAFDKRGRSHIENRRGEIHGALLENGYRLKDVRGGDGRF
jgi:hypothetical protein